MWAAGSGSNGSDLMASGSNRACRLQIGRLGCHVAEAGGGTRQNPLFRGGVRGSSPEFAKSGTPGVNATCFWVWVKFARRIIHWGVKMGSGRPWDAATMVGAVLGHGTRRSGAYWPNCGREKVSKGCARVGSESANPSQGGVVAVLCCGEVRREELAEDAAARRRRAGSKLLGAPRAALACQKGRAGGVGPHRALD